MRFANTWAKAAMALLLLCLPLCGTAQVLLDSVVVRGCKKTRPETIRRVIGVQPGDTVPVADSVAYAQYRERIRNNAYNLGIFTEVWVKQDTALPGFVLEVKVQERWYVWPQAALNLEERTFSEWWQDKDLDRLVYGAGLEWNNFTGRADQLFVYAQGGYSRRINFSYNLPFLFPKRAIDGAMGFRYLNNKEIGYTTVDGILQLARLTDKPMRRSYEWYMQLGKRFSPRKFLYAGFQYNLFRPDDSIAYFNPQYLTTAGNTEQYPSVYLTFLNDQRDVKAFPLKGWKYSVSLRQSGAPGIGTAMFTKLALQWNHHLPLTQRWNWAYSLQSYHLLGDTVPYFDKQFLGFTNFVRGYEKYVIDGSWVGLVKTELKFAVVKRQIVHWKWIPWQKFRDFPAGVYLSVHGDAGCVTDRTFNNQDPAFKNRLLAGYGVGLNVYTVYDFIIRAELSRNLRGEMGVFLAGILAIR